MYSLRAHTISRHLATSLSAPAAIRNPVLRRKMATTAEGKYNWIVIVPDKPGTLAKRLEVRAQHMAGVKKHEASGAVKVGGESTPSEGTLFPSTPFQAPQPPPRPPEKHMLRLGGGRISGLTPDRRHLQRASPGQRPQQVGLLRQHAQRRGRDQG